MDLSKAPDEGAFFYKLTSVAWLFAVHSADVKPHWDPWPSGPPQTLPPKPRDFGARRTNELFIGVSMPP